MIDDAELISRLYAEAHERRVNSIDRFYLRRAADALTARNEEIAELKGYSEQPDWGLVNDLQCNIIDLKQRAEAAERALAEAGHTDTMNDFVLMALSRDDAERRALAAEARAARRGEALKRAANQFQSYARQHYAKGKVNQDMADMCDRAVFGDKENG